MRLATLVPAVLMLALSVPARSDPSTVRPSAATATNEANWADWDAQARVTDGDYDGAVQAAQQARAARQQAEKLAARSTRRHPATPN